jgi:hypothetical protein
MENMTTTRHIHNQGTQKDGLMIFFLAKEYFGFLLYSIFHGYSGMVYDYD